MQSNEIEVSCIQDEDLLPKYDADLLGLLYPSIACSPEEADALQKKKDGEPKFMPFFRIVDLNKDDAANARKKPAIEAGLKFKF